MKYFEIKKNETVEEFLRRVKFDVHSLDYYKIQNVSKPMGRGIVVVTLTNIIQVLKLEVGVNNLHEIKKRFALMSISSGKRKRSIRKDGLDNIENYKG